MTKQSNSFDFGNGWEPKNDFVLIEKIIEDSGSKYSVSMGQVQSRDDIDKFLKRLKSNKKYTKATHNSWAARYRQDNSIIDTKSDDGEQGAGNVILRGIQKENTVNCIVCVTRWFGGVKLMGDRFKHVQDATALGLANIKL